MSENTIQTYQLDCGMPLLVEQFPTAGSVSVNWLLPIGTATFPDEQDGFASMLAELILRGADGRSAREHSDALDRLGVQRTVNVETYHLRIGAVMVGTHLDEALPLLSGMVRRPTLPADAVEPTRSLCLQALDGLKDEPGELVMLRLRERHNPAPMNRHSYGRREVLEHASIESLRDAWETRCVPGGAVLAVAGRCEPDAVAARLNELLVGWTGSWREPDVTHAAERGTLHVPDETAQTHVAMAWSAPKEGEPGAMTDRLGTRILGGGSSSRLFTEVREKRGLCYAVGASYASGLRQALISVYAGSTPQRAQQTVDVIMHEVQRLAEGVSDAEYERAVTGLKSRLIMQGESTSARAAAIAGDQVRLGRPRSLGEIAAEVDAVDHAALDAWLRSREREAPTLVSIGPAPLRLPDPLSTA